ncbi:MAG: M48 family metalloprotease [Burkholderiales bacterium]|nr:M48 family metalloprotease [Burkholderiales bacterium]
MSPATAFNFFLLGCALLLACSGCANAPSLSINNIDVGRVMRGAQNARDVLVDFNQEQEIAIGQSVTSNLLGAAPLLQNTRVQQYVNQVGRWVAAQGERPTLPWTFAVLDVPEINAFAAPGGYIAITRGLLQKMQSEAELAAILAHEIAHVLQRHHLQAIRKAAGANLAGDLISLGLEKKQGGDPILLRLAATGTEIYVRGGLDKADEFEADRMAVVLAARAGYDPYGMPAILQTLQGMNPADAGLSLLFRTHPSLNERLAALDDALPASLERFDRQPDLSLRFREQLGDLYKK